MTRSIQTLDHVIPIIDPAVYAGDYTGIAIDASDPRADDPLVRLDNVGVAYESHHARSDGGNWPYHRPVEGARPDMWLRRSGAEILVRVNERLREFGVELFVLDGYRPIACQRGLWDFFIDEARAENPSASPEECRDFALGHAFDPGPFSEDDPRTWPSHTTGGSVDLTLRDLATGALLDMGVRFEDINPISANDYFERELRAGRLKPDDSRLWNRRLVHWAMQSEGFMNDPFVFWHYDWGNQLYVKIRRALTSDPPAAAWYGYIGPPEALEPPDTRASNGRTAFPVGRRSG